MAQKNAEWKTGQEIEIYVVLQKKWILGKILDIRDDDDQKLYCVAYEEYTQEIHEKDVHSFMRIPQNDNQSIQNDAKKTFLNFSEEIAPKLPLPQQIQFLSDKLSSSAAQRMLYDLSVHGYFQSVLRIHLTPLLDL